jgi:sugar phosphate permease
VIGAGMLIGVAISFGYAAMPAVIMANVPHRQSGIANGINSISRSTGSAIGTAVITTVLASKSVEHVPSAYAGLPAESQFTLSFVIAAVALALVALVSWLGLRTPARAVAESAPAAEAVTKTESNADADTDTVTESASESETVSV